MFGIDHDRGQARSGGGDSSPANDLGRVVEFLRRRTSYPDLPRQVDVIETHISLVFLTDRFVYKLKKPVRFDFLDFSTVLKRRQACQDETRLNSRQARGTYLGVLPVWSDVRGKLHLGDVQPGGSILDWVVQMRRLPTERTLDELIRRHLLTEAEISQLAETLARFYSEAPPLTIRPIDYRASIERHVRANREALLNAGGEELAAVVKRVSTAQLRMLLTAPGEFDRRVLDGRVIEGHGDLRPEHVCLVSPPAVFDCIEFNAELRQLDVADELSFLAMECDMLGASAVGTTVIDAYARRSGDHPPAELLAFYRAYRATVRAKVAVLRGQQLAGHERDEALAHAAQYLNLADRYLHPYSRPLLVMVGGLMGSGKSTLAREISKSLGTELLRSDVIRQEMFPGDRAPQAYNAERYQPPQRSAVYDEMRRRAEQHLIDGASVVLDATFTRLDDRRAAASLGHAHDADVIWVECRCPRNTSMERIEARQKGEEADASEARPELYDRQAHDWQQGELDAHTVVVDTTEATNIQIGVVLGTIAGASAHRDCHLLA